MIIAMDSLTATRFRCSRMYIAADGYHGSLVRVAQTVAGCESLLAEKQRIASSKTRIISFNLGKPEENHRKMEAGSRGRWRAGGGVIATGPGLKVWKTIGKP